MPKIEELVKVKQFASPWHRATINIIYTNNWLNVMLEKRANAKQITLQQFNVLRVLRGQYPNPVTNNLLKERLLTKTPDISRLVDRIVSKGLVSREKNSVDKRAVDLLITDKGLDLLEEIETDMMLDDVLPENISSDDCLKLSELLDKFRGLNGVEY
ncbi:MarR family transcriptional regulator [Sphingobacterium mizutaii NBRC 14946 = DSM 11724]|mgnify:FL=1|uniref:DNA-binding transcriptional repressor MarR n=2 Tax=Sphingobacterium mizutaii TaxID=1010 RepID=A0AAJ4XEZ9_9SPHI|nr:MarR family winged helix-turn-helix transcriptional regulator [Sphingobacterium mizutaii]GEM68104.1 MarR family transcriptional regulator [Sphingobacterium mizutaii NBRC 14946 = DSM 11724]SDL27648.1 DNA-binding transcriptional regulator, MarR family [Sphingobacterium mizutaii]SNV53607.1 DNA-binding transcriptional repressor MarR [Sphingobacterium mizutaii]